MKHEFAFNEILGTALESSDHLLKGCIKVEESDMLKESKGLRPDLLLNIGGGGIPSSNNRNVIS